MKRRTVCLAATILALLVNSIGGVSAAGGTTIWVQPTPEKVVPQTEAMDEYGQHVGRPQPETASTRPVVDKALPDFVPAYQPDELSGTRIMKCSDVLAYICHDYVSAFQ